MERKKLLVAERRALFNRLFLEVAEACGASWENTRKFMVACCWEQGAPAPCKPWREMGGRKILFRCSGEPFKLRRPGGLRSQARVAGRTGGRYFPEFNGGRVTGSKGLPPLANRGGKRKEGKSSSTVLKDSPNYEGREASVPRLRWQDVTGGTLFSGVFHRCSGCRRYSLPPFSVRLVLTGATLSDIPA